MSADAESIAAERRTTPVELLWDLVFVFAITQVTTLLRHDLSWGGFAKGMLVLALVWWAWAAFVWVTNAQPETERTVTVTLLVATAFIFVAGLALPQAFLTHGHAVLFAVSYAVVRFLHLALYADASKKGNAEWSAIAGFAVTVTIGMALLIAGALAHGGVRIALWVVAVAIDYAGPAWTRERLRELQHVAVAHFAERNGLFVIICLGESVVAIGAGAANESLNAARVTAVTLCLLVTIGLWWTYFDELAESAQQRLRDHEEPVLAASDAYSYIHLLVIAGIIIFAVGARLLVHVGDAALPSAARLALCGGIALYLLGQVAFRLRMLGSLDRLRLAAAAVLVAIGWLGSGLHGLAVAAAATAVLAALSTVDAVLTVD